jgi:hypothetical protein
MVAVGLAWDAHPVPERIYNEARVRARRTVGHFPSILEARPPVLELADDTEPV